MNRVNLLSVAISTILFASGALGQDVVNEQFPSGVASITSTSGFDSTTAASTLESASTGDVSGQADEAVPLESSSYEPDPFNASYIGLQRELDLLKLQAEIADVRRRINDADTGKAPGHEANTGSAVGSAPSSAPKARVDRNEGKRIEDLYVTRIEGFGSNLTATVYNRDYVFQVRRGEEVLPGIFVEEIGASGVTFANAKESIRVPLTTDAIARSNTLQRVDPNAQIATPAIPPATPTPPAGFPFNLD